MTSAAEKARAVKEAKPVETEATVVAATDAGEGVEVEIDVVPALSSSKVC